MSYLNAYEVTLAYGGPEEGGWWYSVGHPLYSIEIHSEEGEKRARAQVEAMFGHQYRHCPSKSSVSPRAADLEVCVQDHPAVAFPEFRPHYE